jgi:hypothetical protein
MKYVIIIILSILLLINTFICDPNFVSWLFLCVPVLIAMSTEILRLRKPDVPISIATAIIVLYPIGFLVFLSEANSETTDAQAGLATFMAFFLQYLAIIFIAIFYTIKYLFKRVKQQLT